MKLLKMVCSGLGAVALTAGSIWAFAEPTPEPVSTTPIAACSAGKCGAQACSPAGCDAGVKTVATTCQKENCPSAAKACCDKTVPVVAVESECKGGACPVSAKSCEGKNVSADACPSTSKKCCEKTVPVAAIDACCKADDACVTKSSCKSSECEGQADGCSGECCKAGTCESACCTEKTSADACQAKDGKCGKETIPVAAVESECKGGACPVSAMSDCNSKCVKDESCDGKCCKDGTCKSACCTEKASADACPASKGKCCEKAEPVVAVESECKDGACPVSTKSGCDSKCAKKESCDGKSCKDGSCKSACATEKVSTEACPAKGKCCEEKTVPVGVTADAQVEKPCDKAECGAKSCEDDSCKSGACKSACHDGKVSADACPAAAKECCDKSAPVAAVDSKCEGGACQIERSRQANSEETHTFTITSEGPGKNPPRVALIVDKDTKEESWITNGQISLSYCPGKQCSEKTVAVMATKSKCENGVCPVSAKSDCKSKSATTKVAACSVCGKDRCKAGECADTDARVSKCAESKKCSAGCEAGCPKSRKPVVAETPEKVRQPQASRSIRIRIGYSLQDGPKVQIDRRTVKTDPVVAERNLATVVQDVIGECPPPALQAEMAPPPQPATPRGARNYGSHAYHARGLYPVNSCIINEGSGCMNEECPLHGHHPVELVESELGPPCAHFSNVGYVATSCPLCRHERAARHRAPVFHPYLHPNGPYPGPMALHFDELRAARSLVAEHCPHEAMGPPPVVIGLDEIDEFMAMQQKPVIEWQHPIGPLPPPMAMHPPVALPSTVFHAPHWAQPNVAELPRGPIAAGANEEDLIVRTYVNLHTEPPEITWRELPPRHEHFHPASPRLPIQAVSFEGDAPAPRIHEDHRRGPRPNSSPIEGTWVQHVGETTIRVTCEESRIQGTAVILDGDAENPVAVTFSGTCSVTPDGQLFGAIDNFELHTSEHDVNETRMVEAAMVDQPFAARFRTDGETLFVKDLKCAGLEWLAVEEKGDGPQILSLFGCGRYARDAE